MEIVNGRWVDSNGENLNNFNYDKFSRIALSLSSLYEKDISYDKISLVSFLLSKKDGAEKLSKVIDNEEIMSRL